MNNKENPLLTGPRKPKFFYGYVIIGAGVVISSLMWGAYRSYGIFLEPMTSEVGWSGAATAGAYSVSLLLFGFLGIIAGRLTDKFGAKVVLLSCGLFLGLGYLLMTQVTAVWQLYLCYGVIIGIGMSGADVPVLVMVSRWFVKKRGIATGIAKSGAGIGMLVIPQLSNWLILSYGWRNAFAGIGIISLVGIVAAALLCKRDPGQIGMLPDGADQVPEPGPDITSRQLSLGETLGTAQLWIVSAMWFLLLFCIQVVLLYAAPHVIQLGFSSAVAANVLSIIGAAIILGRIGMGGISDRLGNKLTLFIAFAFLIAALVVVQFARSEWMFYLFAVLYGCAQGAFFTLLSLILAEMFGLRSLGATIGVVLCVSTIGGVVGLVVSGRIFDITGSYQSAFLVCLAVSIIATMLVLFLRPIKNGAPGIMPA